MPKRGEKYGREEGREDEWKRDGSQDDAERDETGRDVFRRVDLNSRLISTLHFMCVARLPSSPWFQSVDTQVNPSFQSFSCTESTQYVSSITPHSITWKGEAESKRDREETITIIETKRREEETDSLCPRGEYCRKGTKWKSSRDWASCLFSWLHASLVILFICSSSLPSLLLSTFQDKLSHAHKDQQRRHHHSCHHHLQGEEHSYMWMTCSLTNCYISSSLSLLPTRFFFLHDSSSYAILLLTRFFFLRDSSYK